MPWRIPRSSIDPQVSGQAYTTYCSGRGRIENRVEHRREEGHHDPDELGVRVDLARRAPVDGQEEPDPEGRAPHEHEGGDDGEQRGRRQPEPQRPDRQREGGGGEGEREERQRDGGHVHHRAHRQRDPEVVEVGILVLPDALRDDVDVQQGHLHHHRAHEDLGALGGGDDLAEEEEEAQGEDDDEPSTSS